MERKYFEKEMLSRGYAVVNWRGDLVIRWLSVSCQLPWHGEGRNHLSGGKYVDGEHVEKDSKSVETALGMCDYEESKTR